MFNNIKLALCKQLFLAAANKLGMAITTDNKLPEQTNEYDQFIQCNTTLPEEPVQGTKHLPFPILSGKSSKEIEDSIEKHDEKYNEFTYFTLVKLKEYCSQDEFQMYTELIKMISSSIHKNKPDLPRTPLDQLLSALYMRHEIAVKYGNHSKEERKEKIAEITSEFLKCIELQITTGRIIELKGDLSTYKFLENNSNAKLFKKILGELEKTGPDPTDIVRLFSGIVKCSPADKIKSLIENIAEHVKSLEEVSSGAGRNLIRAINAHLEHNPLEESQDQYKERVSSFLNNISEHLDGFEKLTRGLANQGENNIPEAIGNFGVICGEFEGKHAILPTKKVVENLLKLNYYAGIVRVSSFTFKPSEYTNQQTCQEILEESLADCTRNFESTSFTTNDKVAVVFLAGTDNEMNALSRGNTGREIFDLIKHGYKVFPFEIYTDKQAEVVKNKVHEFTGLDLRYLSFDAHGSSGGPVYLGGDSNVEEEDSNLNEQIRRYEQLEIVSENGLKRFPPWILINLKNTKLSYDDVHLDKSDSDLFTDKGLNNNTIILLNACKSGEEHDELKIPSVARIVATSTGVKTLAPQDSIHRYELVFNKDGDVETVIYYADNKKITPKVFFEKEN